MRASLPGLSLPFAPSATAVFDPANRASRPRAPSTEDTLRLPCDYLVDMVQGPVPQDRPMQSLEGFDI